MMVRSAIVGSVLAWMLSAPAAASLAAGGSSVATHTQRSTAHVTARVTDRTEAVGSGVILAVTPNVIVLTARHLAARKNLALRTFAGETLRIVAEYEVADRDLAVLIANGPCVGCEAVETADAITVGQPIHVWGNPHGKPFVLSPGTIVDLKPTLPGFATNGRFALACDSCDVGDSGGGVFDAQGRLLGIITEGWTGLNAADKRVIAEPANQALAHVALAYVSTVRPPPLPPPPAFRTPGDLAPGLIVTNAVALSLCISGRNVEREVLAGLAASRRLPSGSDVRRLTRDATRAVARQLSQQCEHDGS